MSVSRSKLQGRPIPTPSSPKPKTPRRRTANQASRLTGTGAFEAIFRNGSRHEGRYVQIVTAPAGERIGRVGFVVGRKALARAVDRNRLKRVLREFLRSCRSDVGAFDLVIRLKRPVTREALAEVAHEAAALIRKAITSPPAGTRETR